MKKFYRYIDIPNLKLIQAELLNLSDYKNYEGPVAQSWRHDYYPVKDRLPYLSTFLKRSKVPVSMIKYYSLPPSGILGHHIDGPPIGYDKIKYPKSFAGPKFSFNIPLLNCDNTFTHWYESDLDNLMPLNSNYRYNGEFVEKGYMSNAWVPVDSSKIKEIKKAETNKPIIIKTDILHSGSNPNNSTRVLASIRLDLGFRVDKEEFEDFFDITGLNIDC